MIQALESTVIETKFQCMRKLENMEM